METTLEELMYKEPLNVTRIIDYDGDSRYLVIATVGETIPIARQKEIQGTLDTWLTRLFVPALVCVIVVDQGNPIDLEFFRLKNEDACK